MTTVQILLDLIQRIVDEHTPGIIIPTILGGQAHAVQQKAVKQLGVGGQLFEALVRDELTCGIR